MAIQRLSSISLVIIKDTILAVQLSVPIFNGFSTRNNVSRSKVSFERSKIALSQSELDLERNVFTAYTDAKGAFNAYEAALLH
jgi:outer membrane protein